MAALRSWANDPWFSLSWTLQEAMLRRDAIIISREGEIILSIDCKTLLDLSMLENFF